MWMSKPNQWFSDNPFYFSICFRSSPMRGVATNSIFLKYVSTGNCDCWNFTSSFVFVSQYSWIVYFMMWYIWSILIPYLIWIMLILGIFSVGYSCKVNSKRVSNYCVIISKQIILPFSNMMPSVSTERNDL